MAHKGVRLARSEEAAAMLDLASVRAVMELRDVPGKPAACLVWLGPCTWLELWHPYGEIVDMVRAEGVEPEVYPLAEHHDGGELGQESGGHPPAE